MVQDRSDTDLYDKSFQKTGGIMIKQNMSGYWKNKAMLDYAAGELAHYVGCPPHVVYGPDRNKSSKCPYELNCKNCWLREIELKTVYNNDVSNEASNGQAI